jgi:superoxide dismutase, Cu-Zn family
MSPSIGAAGQTHGAFAGRHEDRMTQRNDSPGSRRLDSLGRSSRWSHPSRSRCRLSAFAALFAALTSGVLLSGCGLLFQNHEKRAEAVLQPSSGSSARGSVTFIERADGVQVSYNLSGMPPDSEHALQIHERGDCIVANLPDIGPVFAPAAERSKPGSKVEGDLTTIHADAYGSATGFVVAPDLSLDGVRSVVSRAIVLHRDSSDPYAVVARGAGPALACGVIRQ